MLRKPVAPTDLERKLHTANVNLRVQNIKIRAANINLRRDNRNLRSVVWQQKLDIRALKGRLNDYQSKYGGLDAWTQTKPSRHRVGNRSADPVADGASGGA